MKVFNGYRNVTGLKAPVAAVGIFDGIHIGHMKVLRRVLQAKQAASDRVVITFDPHPRSVLSPAKPLPRIMSLEHRLLIFEKMGMDAVVVLHFSEYLAGMSPEDFMRRVIVPLGAGVVYVGENFHFGRKRSGNVDKLKAIGGRHGVDVKKIRPVRRRGRVVSSTWVRELVTAGKLHEAEKLLRRPVSVLGTVVSGDSRGTRLGIPTANIDPHHEVIPPPGVYAVKADISGRLHDGILNIGFRPTFYGRTGNRRREPSVEVHIFDYSGHLYGLAMEVFFMAKLRNERKFRKEEDLVERIKKDSERARAILGDTARTTRIRRYLAPKSLD